MRKELSMKNYLATKGKRTAHITASDIVEAYKKARLALRIQHAPIDVREIL